MSAGRSFHVNVEGTIRGAGGPPGVVVSETARRRERLCVLPYDSRERPSYFRKSVRRCDCRRAGIAFWADYRARGVSGTTERPHRADLR
jgi:hypothetical protein